MTQSRRDVVLPTFGGLKLRGWFYGAGEQKPCIIMTHGFGARKNAYLPDFANRFQKAGYGVLLYDNRNWGDSEGQPRNEVDPILQARDYSDAFDFAASLPEVDATKIVYWGTSMSGGVSICAAAVDKRIKAVIAQGLFVSGEVIGEQTKPLHPLIFGNRTAVKSGKTGMMLPIAPENQEELKSGECMAVLQDADVFAYHDELDARGVVYEKLVTANSTFNLLSFEPRAHIHRVSPTPLLMVLADNDHVIGTANQVAMFERAKEPKQLYTIKDVGHFGIYFGQKFEENIEVQLKFLKSVL